MSAITFPDNAHLANALEYSHVVDPDNAGTINPGRRGLAYCALKSAAASETRTLADPTAANDRLMLYMLTDNGDITVTATSALDETGNTTLVFNDVGQFADLISVHDASGTLAWRITARDAGAGAPAINIGDNTTYTMLPSNSGKLHYIPDLTSDLTITMPAEVAGLVYEFCYTGAASDAQDWILDTGSDTNYYLGGVVHLDDDAGSAGDEVVPVYSDGNSNSKFTVLTPDCGTWVKVWCDGTLWIITGTVVSSSAPTFADQ